jgi:phospho-N-acetylmuramoyl-pentapeptide-transferase
VFYWLYEMYFPQFSPLRVFSFPSFRIVAATATALLITLMLYPWFIGKLRDKQVGEVIRDDGPETHQKKAGTPTMGGILILIAMIVSTLLWTRFENRLVWLVLLITLGYGAIGFLDDLTKLRGKKRGGRRGLTEVQKLLAQFLVAGCGLGLFFYAMDPAAMGYTFKVYIPFVKADALDTTVSVWVYLVLGLMVVVSTSNGVNLTDGLDGLAIGPVIIAAGTFLVLCYLAGFQIYVDGVTNEPVVIADMLKIPKMDETVDLAVVCGAIVGSGIGFLWYNTHPATVFLGDVGSLSLGAALGSVAVFSKNELLSLIIFGIFAVELLSSFIQRIYFRATGGKRIFLMAPIHHHFEKKGWSEPQIVVRFWIIAIILSLISLMSLKLR